MHIVERLCQRIPGGASSPLRTFSQVHMSPIVIDRGEGGSLIDVEGKRFVDLIGAYGIHIHGHSHTEIVNAQREQIKKGICFGLSTSIEAELAEKIVKHMPSLESIRFVSTGTEAVMSAVRLARGFTKRELVVKFSGNYHGHVDYLLADSGSALFQENFCSTSAGVPQDMVRSTVVLPYNDLAAFSKFMDVYGDRVAASIVEPIAGNMGVILPVRGFLEHLRKKSDEKGSLLLFDEVITGFRVAMDGAQGLFGIKPDLTCLGKVIGGGMPLAAFGGRREIMESLAPLGSVFQAGTFAGHPLSIASGIKAIELCEEVGFYENLLHKTETFLAPIKRRIIEKKAPIFLQGIGSMFTFFFGIDRADSREDVKKADLETFRLFFRHLLGRGVLMAPSQYEALFISSAHTEEELKIAQDAILDFIDTL